MASEKTEPHYIPYEATAEVIVSADSSPTLFLLSIFPDATPDQIALFKDYTKGKLLDGIHYGRATVEGIDDPVSRIEAYSAGVEEGFERAQQTQQED